MSAAAIRAGNAWVEVGSKDKTGPGLKAIQQRFMSWGQGLARVGGLITGASSGILGALTGAAKIFADTGSEIYDMSRATGVGAEELSALKYAAEQSGSGLSGIGGAMKGIGKFTGQIAAGSKPAIKALDQLGISSEDFLAATPYERFLLVADGLKGISDPSLRSALAMKTLGKGASELGSLLAEGADGVKALVAEADRLGLTITKAEAEKADALGDAWGAVGEQFKRIAFQVGAALADTLISIGKQVQPVLAAVIKWIRMNPVLITTIAAVAAAGLVLGGVLLGISGMLVAVGMALQVILAPATLIVGAIALLGAALVGGAAYWLFYTESGQAALSAIANSTAWQLITGTIQGIYDAIASGNWKLAGEVLMAALNAAFVAGIEGLKILWANFQQWMTNLFASLFEKMGEFQTKAGTLLTGLSVGLSVAGAPKAVTDRMKSVGMGITAGGATISGAAKGIRAGADVAHDQAVADASQKIIDASMELTRKIAEAKAERERQELKPPPTPDQNRPSASMPIEGGAAVGAFNSAMKGMLAATVNTVQERIAKAAEKSADTLDDIDRKLDDLNEVEE